MIREGISIPVDNLTLQEFFLHPGQFEALAICAHGSGNSSSRKRSEHVAHMRYEHDLVTLPCNLASQEEKLRDEQDSSLRADIPLLARRLAAIVDWARNTRATSKDWPGLFGLSTGAADAAPSAHTSLIEIFFLVPRNRRPHLAKDVLEDIISPTLLNVGEKDIVVLDLNEVATAHMQVKRRVMHNLGATHLFNEASMLGSGSTPARPLPGSGVL